MNPNSSFSKDSLPSGCAFAFTHSARKNLSYAYLDTETIFFSVHLDRKIYSISLCLEIYDESLKKLVHTAELSWTSANCDKDEYRTRFSASKLGIGLYFAILKIQYGEKELYGYKINDSIIFTDRHVAPNIQFTISKFVHSEPSQFYGGTIYHIFVDRFAKGGNYPVKNGAVLVKDWADAIPEYPEYPGAPLKNNTFYGGTLDGIIEKLEYIKSLGANIIYLSPIFDSASNHKYDTGDYMTVDSMFGGVDALKRLIGECHKRDMYLILDGVFNHTGADSIYFNKYGNYQSLGAYQSKESKFYSWYDFQSHPDKYTAWWGIEILPRINTMNESCKRYFLGEGGVIDTYSNMGIDGMRLDVVDELADDFVAELKNVLSKNGRSNILYGEVWEDASNKIAYSTRKKYYLGRELDGVMNYPLRNGLIDYINKRDSESLRYALTDIINNAPERIAHAQMNLLGTHDTERILTVLGGDKASGKTNSELSKIRMIKAQKDIAVKKLKALYTINATLPGIPSIFYGDEAGLEGYSDPFNRMPYPWGKENKELLEHYKKIGNIRKRNTAYKTGKFKLLRLSRDILIFARIIASYAYVTVFNNSDRTYKVEFSAPSKSLISKFENTHYIPPTVADIFKTKTNSTITIKISE